MNENHGKCTPVINIPLKVKINLDTYYGEGIESLHVTVEG